MENSLDVDYLNSQQGKTIRLPPKHGMGSVRHFFALPCFCHVVSHYLYCQILKRVDFVDLSKS